MNNIITVARQEIGYTEIPKYSNSTKYGAWFGLDEVPWCAIFVCWVYYHAGYPLGNMGWSKGFAGCQSGLKLFSDKNEITTTPQEGDLVFFDWNGDGRFDHVGLYVEKIDDQHFSTIEGNTSYTNQSNGEKSKKESGQYIMQCLYILR